MPKGDKASSIRFLKPKVSAFQFVWSPNLGPLKKAHISAGLFRSLFSYNVFDFEKKRVYLDFWLFIIQTVTLCQVILFKKSWFGIRTYVK